MKKFRFALLFLFLTGALLSAGLLKNADFSQGTEGWKLETSEGVSGQAKVLPGEYEGKNALVLTFGPGDPKPWGAWISSENIVVEPGKNYVLRFVARLEGGRKARKVCFVEGVKENRSIDRQSFAPDMEWQEYVFSFIPTQKELHITIGDIGWPDSTLYISGLTFEQE
ncbi:hypothetical protein DB345_09505 [Spartobacteria bacterium LR76]|nr:hypothetical protein DB345_09505 [Spartobacteria bacterium LR76]